MGREKKKLNHKKYLQSSVTGLLLQGGYKVQWILNVSKKSPCPVFLICWVVKNVEGDGLRTFSDKKQYIAEISKSWENLSNVMAVAVSLLNYKTYSNQRHDKTIQNEGKLFFVSCMKWNIKVKKPEGP